MAGERSVLIADGAIQGDLGLSTEEFTWLRETWYRATGEKLRPTWLNQITTLLAGGDQD